MPSPKRILYVHNSADIYGASRSLLRLLPEVKQRGFDPVVVLPEDGPLRLRIEQLQLGITVHIEPGLSVIDRGAFGSFSGVARFLCGFPFSVVRLWRLIRRHHINLVHTNTGVMPSTALAACLARVPHVWHVRDSFQEFRSLWSVYRRYITGLSRRVICVSHPIANQFPGARNVTVIHNGLPLDEFPENPAELRTKFREEYALSNAVAVGCVGRIKFVRKGQEVLVQAIAKLKQRGFSTKGLIVGSTSTGNEEHLTRLQKLITDLGLTFTSTESAIGSQANCSTSTRQSQTFSPSGMTGQKARQSEGLLAPAAAGMNASKADVIFTGELADPKPAYAAMDVFVLPSAQPEPFGGVVLEAMAMSRPVIATAIGGSLDQVVDGKTGFLVPPGDADALAAKLEVLLQNGSLREQMGLDARRRLEECFSIDQMVEKLMAVYREALNQESK